jgi:fibrillarin-like rRNA methylase
MSVDGVQIPILTKKVRSDSGTGVKGVYRRVRKGTVYFEAHISVKGKRIWGPIRRTLAEAIADRKALEEQHHKPYLEKAIRKDDPDV